MALNTRHTNPFPVPSALEKVLLKELALVAKHCYDRGWSGATAGNFSLRGSAGLLWQSPSGVNKGALDPQLFVPVEISSGQMVGPLERQPSLEMPVHIGIYRAEPTARCVVHTHPPYLVARSRSGGPLVFQGEEMQKALGSKDHKCALRLPVLVNPTPHEMPRLATTLAADLVPGVPLVVLAAHGVYAWGRTPFEALGYVEAAEFLCRTGPT